MNTEKKISRMPSSVSFSAGGMFPVRCNPRAVGIRSTPPETQIYYFFGPYSTGTEEMLEIAVQHVTPGRYHNYNENEQSGDDAQGDTSDDGVPDVEASDNSTVTADADEEPGIRHEGSLRRYIHNNSQGQRATYCLQSVNDAATETGAYRERIQRGAACYAGPDLESRGYVNLLETSPWNSEINSENGVYMAPRGAILLYQNSGVQCRDERGHQGHIEFKLSDSETEQQYEYHLRALKQGLNINTDEDFRRIDWRVLASQDYRYVSIAGDVRPAMGMEGRDLVGVYVKMPTEFSADEVVNRANALVANNSKYSDSELASGEDIQCDRRALTETRKRCLLEARSAVYYITRAMKELQERPDWTLTVGAPDPLNQVISDVAATKMMLTYSTDNTPKRREGMTGCLTDQTNSDLNDLRSIFDRINGKLNMKPVENVKCDALDMMQTSIEKLKLYYNTIRADRNLRDRN